MLVAVVAGVLSYFRLGRSEDPTFIIKTMVVQAAWPGATVEDTLKQVTERLERKLQETPKLDFLRSFTAAGMTTIFVNLKGEATAQRSTRHLVSRAQEHRRHPSHLAGGHRRTGLQRRVRRHVRDHLRLHRRRLHASRAARLRRRRALETPQVPDVSKIEILGAQDEKIFVEFSMKELASLGIDRAALIAALQAQNVVQPAGTMQTGTRRCHCGSIGRVSDPSRTS